MTVIIGTEWTDEMIEQLKDLKSQGLTGEQVGVIMHMTKDAVNKAWGRYRPRPTPETSPPSPSLALADFAKHYDTRQAILDAIAAMHVGELRYQAEICQIASPHDRPRFNRCVEMHDEEFAKYRIKARMSNWPEARWVWGLPTTINALREMQEKT